MLYLGFDIGGTKCAVTLGDLTPGKYSILEKKRFPTPAAPGDAIDALVDAGLALVEGKKIAACGISCGGPLDSRRGLILSPPNLPGWDNIPITERLESAFRVPAYLQNDANACAAAEWQFGAGQGCRNMMFCTFGTGFGAGLILDNRLYVGENDNAGELGHVRLTDFGPSGYGKLGSVEGFCSGAGLAKLGRMMAEEHIQRGDCPKVVADCGGAEHLTAANLAQAADVGDPFAVEVYQYCGRRLGQALAIAIDLLNPAKIVIGSVFARSGHLLRDSMEKTIHEEALPLSRAVCEVVPAALGESLGDVAALTVAYTGMQNR